MSFNSILFIFGFLPFAVIGYYALALTPMHPLRLPFLIAATLLFYWRGSAHFLPLLLGSVAANYVCSLLIVRLRAPWNRLMLWIGVLANVGGLIWFKYANFIVDSLSSALGLNIDLGRVALPLAISFYTFQQIAHLVDLSRGRIEMPRAIDYAAFILFFPQLLAGPISLSREMIPQLRQRPVANIVPTNLLVGLLIFGLGLFKKTVVADSFALWTDPVFKAAAEGATPSALIAWGCAFAYTLQIYFDFAGYSDMAIGIARLFGVKLPLNFHSPLRAESIQDLWRRWHITLGRFVQSYVYQPMAVPLTRFALNRDMGPGATLVISTLVPTFVAMVVIGAWHGGNWTYVLFGVMQGLYMMTNEVWNFFMRAKKRVRNAAAARFHVPWGTPLTVFCFALASVPFRSADLATTWRIFSAMLGIAGPDPWDKWPVLTPLGAWGLYPLIALGFLVVFTMPNTQQIMGRVTPALEWSRWKRIGHPPIAFEWRPTALPTFLIGVVFLVGLVFISRGSTQFIYFGF